MFTLLPLKPPAPPRLHGALLWSTHHVTPPAYWILPPTLSPVRVCRSVISHMSCKPNSSWQSQLRTYHPVVCGGWQRAQVQQQNPTPTATTGILSTPCASPGHGPARRLTRLLEDLMMMTAYPYSPSSSLEHLDMPCSPSSPLLLLLQWGGATHRTHNTTHRHMLLLLLLAAAPGQGSFP